MRCDEEPGDVCIRFRNAMKTQNTVMSERCVMRKLSVIALVAAFVMSGCGQNKVEREGYGPGEIEKWEDPNFRIITIGAYNYTDYDIGTVFLLPPDKSDIDYAARTGGGKATGNDASSWQYDSGSGPALAWDLRWPRPKRFKVWWFRITDKAAFDRARSAYDPYTDRSSGVGGAWCEYEFEVKEKFGEPFGPPYPQRYRDQMVLYFFPDGTVQGHLEFAVDSDIEPVDIAKRNELPTLKDRPCLKEIGNPYFGKKRPISIN
jgi:hypothetical protein